MRLKWVPALKISIQTPGLEPLQVIDVESIQQATIFLLFNEMNFS